MQTILRRLIKPGEDTRIDIEFVKVSSKGGRKSIPGKEIQLKIEGLKDGVISPKGKVSTNAEGKATLVYQAGQNDHSVRVTASYQPQKYPDRAEGSAVVLVQEGKGDLEVDIRGTVNWVHDYPEHRVSLVTNIVITGTMALNHEKHGGAFQSYKTNDVQMKYTHLFKVHRKVPDKNCPETLETEATSAGTVPVTSGTLTIRYPRPEARRARQTGISFDFKKNAPGQIKSLIGCKYMTIEDLGFVGAMFQVVDSSPIRKDQKEFSGSASFGIDPGRDPDRFMHGVPFLYYDDKSSEFKATFPTDVDAKEMENILASGDLEKLKNRTWGFKPGNDGRLTWKIKKIKHKD